QIETYRAIELAHRAEGKPAVVVGCRGIERFRPFATVPFLDGHDTFTDTAEGATDDIALRCAGGHVIDIAEGGNRLFAGCSGIFIAVAGCSRIYVAVARRSGIYIAVAGSSGIYVAVAGRSGVYVAAPGGTGIYGASSGGTGGCGEDAGGSGSQGAGSGRGGL